MNLAGQLFSIIGVIAMLMVAWIIGTHIWNMTSFAENTTAIWILRISLIMILFVGIALIPILNSIGKEIHPLAGIEGLMFALIALPVTVILTGVIWTFAENMLNGFVVAPTLLWIVQMIIILAIFVFNFVAPILIMIGEVDILPNGEQQ